MSISIVEIKKALATPKDLSNVSIKEKATTLVLHFIGYLAKPIGIPDSLYDKCLEAFNVNRGKVEWEEEAVLGILKECETKEEVR